MPEILQYGEYLLYLLPLVGAAALIWAWHMTRQSREREREVLHLIAEGFAAKEIAQQLHISTKTVEAHRTSLMRKLGVRKATELVRYAVRHGLIEP